MEVTFDETWQDIAAPDVHPGAVVIAQPHDDAIEQGHVNFLPAAPVEVGNPPPGQYQVRGGFPPGHPQPPRQPTLGHS